MVDITLSASTILARLAAGDAKDASVAEILTLLNVAAGADVTGTANVTSALPVPDSTVLVDFGTDKAMRIDVGAVADSTTRVLTMPNADIDLTPGTGSFATEAEGNLASAALPKSGGEMSGNITMAAAETVDGRDLSADGTRLDTMASNADVVIGKHTIWVPAAAMTPSVTAGCGAINKSETTAGKPDIKYLPFSDSAEEHAQFSVAFPKGWNLGVVTYQVFWSRIAAPTGGADDVHWGLQGVSITDDVTMDSAYGSEVEVDVDEAQATEDLWVSAESGNVTLALTPIDDDLCEFQISRVVGSETGGLDVDACLIGIKLFYTIDAGTDA